MNPISSVLVPIELSFDSEVSWQILVCLTQYNVPLSREITTTNSFCGPSVGLGALSFNPTGTAICEQNPTAGSQVTYKTLLEYIHTGTSIKFRVRHPGSGSTANNFFLKGDCKVTDLDLIFESTENVTFSWTLTGEGTLDIANP